MYYYTEQSNEAVIQNLKDAGCDDSMIEAFMKDIENGRLDDGLRLLAVHRRTLLDGLHKDQRKIDCLDYLIYTMKKAKA